MQSFYKTTNKRLGFFYPIIKEWHAQDLRGVHGKCEIAGWESTFGKPWFSEFFVFIKICSFYKVHIICPLNIFWAINIHSVLINSLPISF